MKFYAPLIRGRLLLRYKRFLADVKLDNGSIVTAHCANPGSMESIKEPGSEVWLSPAQNKNRKLQFTWEIIRIGSTLVGVNTNLPNKLVTEAINSNLISELNGYETLKNEINYGKNSRIDIFLTAKGRPDCYVEVKSTTLRRDLSDQGPVEFPDAVTTRGAKHLRELTDMVSNGCRSVMFYLVQRDDAQNFQVAADIDPNYANAFKVAVKAGVEILCYSCHLTTKEITIGSALKVKLPQ